MPVATIAERHGHTPQRVADAIATLRHRGELTFRTNLARAVSGWPVYTWYFVEAPARTIEVARSAFGSVPEVRLAATSPSRYNLILAVWLRRLADVNRFEMALGGALEGARIADRSLVVRIRKHMSQILAPDPARPAPAQLSTRELMLRASWPAGAGRWRCSTRVADAIAARQGDARPSGRPWPGTATTSPHGSRLSSAFPEG